MRADFTPPPPDRSKDRGYVDVTVNTMPDAETLAKAREEVNLHKLRVAPQTLVVVDEPLPGVKP